MDLPPNLTQFVEQLSVFASDLAASAPEHFGRLAEILGEPELVFSSSSLDLLLSAIRDLEKAGPQQLSAVFSGLSGWASSDGGIAQKLKPLLDAFSALLASAQLDDAGPRLDAAVMPWLERLGEACVSAIMGDS